MSAQQSTSAGQPARPVTNPSDAVTPSSRGGDGDIVLSVSDVSKRFGGLQALADVGLEIRRGQIYGLIGPNGAGKTTFFNVITGLYTPDSGTFMLEGKPYEPSAVHKVAEAGIARTFQNIRLFGEMTAMENVMVGRHVRTHAGVIGAVFKLAERAARGGSHPPARAGTARVRRHPPVRRLPGPYALLRRPAPARDRPRPGHRSQAAGAG